MKSREFKDINYDIQKSKVTRKLSLDESYPLMSKETKKEARDNSCNVSCNMAFQGVP